MHKSIEHKNKHNRQRIGEIPKSIYNRQKFEHNRLKPNAICRINNLKVGLDHTLWPWAVLTAPIAPSDIYGWYTETFKFVNLHLYIIGLGKHGRFKQSSNKCVPC